MSMGVTFLNILLMITVASAATVKPVIIPGNENETCPEQNEREAAIQNFKTTINLIYTLQDTNLYVCGSGPWYRIAHFNMSDPTQQCPSAWREFNSGGVRACARPITFSGSCPATFYATGRQYSKVCGRAIGYQFGSPDAFSYVSVPQIDTYPYFLE